MMGMTGGMSGSSAMGSMGGMGGMSAGHNFWQARQMSAAGGMSHMGYGSGHGHQQHDAKMAEKVGARIHEVMCTSPKWASNLPLAAEGVVTTMAPDSGAV